MSGPFNKMKKSASGFGSVLKGVLGAQVIMRGVQALGQGIRYVTGEFVDFDAALTGAGAKFKDMSSDMATSQKQMESLTAAARQVGATTEFSATEAAQGLEFLAMAGFGVEQSIAALPGVVDLATAANTDLATATDIASDSLGAFNLMTDDTVKLQENLARVNNVMAKTTTTANTDLATLFEAVKKGGPAFTAAGQSIESFSAFAGVMANAGVKGSEAGTSLRNVMLRLADPTSEAASIIKKLGVTTQDEAGNFRDIIDILADFETGLVGMGDAQKTAALSTVFGARSVTGINILLAEGTDKLRDYRTELENADTAAADMAATIRGSLANRLKVLKSSLTETGFKFIEAFGDKLSLGLNKLIEMTQGMNDFLEANKQIINSGVDKFFNVLKIAFDFIKPVIIAVANAWQELVSSMRESGSFDKLKTVFMGLVEQLVPLRNTVIDIFNVFKDFLINSGIADLAVAIFGSIAAQVKLLAGAFRFLWQIAKPILNVMGTIISPLVTLLTKMIELTSKIPSGIGGLLNKGADFFGGNTTAEQISNTTLTAPNATEEQVKREMSEQRTINEQVISINDNTGSNFTVEAPGIDRRSLGYAGR